MGKAKGSKGKKTERKTVPFIPMPSDWPGKVDAQTFELLAVTVKQKIEETKQHAYVRLRIQQVSWEVLIHLILIVQ
jgi:hypothetical protein